MLVTFDDGTVGEINDSVFNWICRISESSFNPEYWKWIETLNHEKIVVEMNRFKWTLFFLSWPYTDVLQKNGQELFACPTDSEFDTIKECRNANVDLCGREED